MMGKVSFFESVSYYVSSEILHHLSEAVSSAKLGDLSYSVRLIDNQIESLLAERHLARRGRSLNAACVIKGLQCRGTPPKGFREDRSAQTLRRSGEGFLPAGADPGHGRADATLSASCLVPRAGGAPPQGIGPGPSGPSRVHHELLEAEALPMSTPTAVLGPHGQPVWKEAPSVPWRPRAVG